MEAVLEVWSSTEEEAEEAPRRAPSLSSQQGQPGPLSQAPRHDPPRAPPQAPPQAPPPAPPQALPQAPHQVSRDGSPKCPPTGSAEQEAAEPAALAAAARLVTEATETGAAEPDALELEGESGDDPQESSDDESEESEEELPGEDDQDVEETPERKRPRMAANSAPAVSPEGADAALAASPRSAELIPSSQDGEAPAAPAAPAAAATTPRAPSENTSVPPLPLPHQLPPPTRIVEGPACGWEVRVFVGVDRADSRGWAPRGEFITPQGKSITAMKSFRDCATFDKHMKKQILDIYDHMRQVAMDQWLELYPHMRHRSRPWRPGSGGVAGVGGAAADAPARGAACGGGGSSAAGTPGGAMSMAGAASDGARIGGAFRADRDPWREAFRGPGRRRLLPAAGGDKGAAACDAGIGPEGVADGTLRSRKAEGAAAEFAAASAGAGATCACTSGEAGAAASTSAGAHSDADDARATRAPTAGAEARRPRVEPPPKRRRIGASRRPAAPRPQAHVVSRLLRDDSGARAAAETMLRDGSIEDQADAAFLAAACAEIGAADRLVEVAEGLLRTGADLATVYMRFAVAVISPAAEANRVTAAAISLLLREPSCLPTDPCGFAAANTRLCELVARGVDVKGARGVLLARGVSPLASTLALGRVLGAAVARSAGAEALDKLVRDMERRLDSTGDAGEALPWPAWSHSAALLLGLLRAATEGLGVLPARRLRAAAASGPVGFATQLEFFRDLADFAAHASECQDEGLPVRAGTRGTRATSAGGVSTVGGPSVTPGVPVRGQARGQMARQLLLQRPPPGLGPGGFQAVAARLLCAEGCVFATQPASPLGVLGTALLGALDPAAEGAARRAAAERAAVCGASLEPVVTAGDPEKLSGVIRAHSPEERKDAWVAAIAWAVLGKLDADFAFLCSDLAHGDTGRGDRTETLARLLVAHRAAVASGQELVFIRVVCRFLAATPGGAGGVGGYLALGADPAEALPAAFAGRPTPADAALRSWAAHAAQRSSGACAAYAEELLSDLSARKPSWAMWRQSVALLLGFSPGARRQLFAGAIKWPLDAPEGAAFISHVWCVADASRAGDAADWTPPARPEGLLEDSAWREASPLVQAALEAWSAATDAGKACSTRMVQPGTLCFDVFKPARSLLPRADEHASRPLRKSLQALLGLWMRALRSQRDALERAFRAPENRTVGFARTVAVVSAPACASERLGGAAALTVAEAVAFCMHAAGGGDPAIDKLLHRQFFRDIRQALPPQPKPHAAQKQHFHASSFSQSSQCAKLNGMSFDDVLTKEPSLASWMLGRQQVTGEVDRFVQWVRVEVLEYEPPWLRLWHPCPAGQEKLRSDRAGYLASRVVVARRAAAFCLALSKGIAGLASLAWLSAEAIDAAARLTCLLVAQGDYDGPAWDDIKHLANLQKPISADLAGEQRAVKHISVVLKIFAARGHPLERTERDLAACVPLARNSTSKHLLELFGKKIADLRNSRAGGRGGG